MKGIILYLLLVPVICNSQTVDTVIKNEVYTSYFSYHLHEPLYVKYVLYQGGGDCSRAGMRFTTNGLDSSATAADYAGNGYDEGHLCNAEDEAADCDRERVTFHFYNCLPQTPRLNRGIWKHFETIIRKESQSDSLLIICGGYGWSKKIGHAFVPDYCFKAVISLTTHNITHCIIFPNDNSDTVEDIPVNDLINNLGYNPFTPQIVSPAQTTPPVR
jgi:endonuclease G, mitochondrial